MNLKSLLPFKTTTLHSEQSERLIINSSLVFLDKLKQAQYLREFFWPRVALDGYILRLLTKFALKSVEVYQRYKKRPGTKYLFKASKVTAVW